MYKLCKTESSAKRQQSIENALLCLMKTKKYEEINVSEICDSINIPRKAFYRYFDSKDGALHALIDHTMLNFQEFSMKYRMHESRSVERDLECFFLFWIEKASLITALERSNLDALLFQKAFGYPINELINTKKFLPNDDESVRPQIFNFAICGLMTLMLEWYRGGFKETTLEMARLSCRLLSQPIFPDLDKLS